MIDSLGSIRECLRMLVDLVAVGLKDNEGCIGVKALFRINVDAVVEDTSHSDCDYHFGCQPQR